MIQPRQAITALTVSAALLVGIATHEGYVETVAPPVPGDVPTNGFGGPTSSSATRRLRFALVRLLADADRHAQAVKLRAGADVPARVRRLRLADLQHRGQRFLFLDPTKKLNAGDYAGACREILRWDKFKGQPLPTSKRRQSEYQQVHRSCRMILLPVRIGLMVAVIAGAGIAGWMWRGAIAERDIATIEKSIAQQREQAAHRGPRDRTQATGESQ